MEGSNSAVAAVLEGGVLIGIDAYDYLNKSDPEAGIYSGWRSIWREQHNMDECTRNAIGRIAF